MEEFQTFSNNQKIHAEVVETISIAQKQGATKFLLRNKNNLNDYEGFGQENKVSFSKEQVKDKSILEMQTFFMVDVTQIDYIDKIIAETYVLYKVNDRDNKSSYESNYLINEEEFIKNGNLFRIIKRIEIKLKENMRSAFKKQNNKLRKSMLL